jgi:conjugal transfer pilus assembly protein TraE
VRRVRYESEKVDALSGLLWWRGVAVAMVVSNLFLGSLLMMSDTTEKTIVTPPIIEKSFWIKGSEVSPEYLEEITRFLSTLVLNSTPKSIDGNIEMFLRYVDPLVYGDLRAIMGAKADKVKKLDMSTAFYPVKMSTKSETEKTVVVEGDFVTIVGSKQVNKERRSWRFAYAFNGGRLWVKEYFEVDNADPFDSDAIDVDDNMAQ